MSIVGVDVGTSRVKAIRFDDSWRPVDAEAESSLVCRDARGRAEQDMDEVWSSVARVLAAVARRSVDPVTLVAVTAQGDGCWLVDHKVRPVGPALLWNDNRAAPVVDRWRHDGTLAAAFARNGCLAAPGIAHAQLRWLHENDPAVLTRASHLLSCGSWIYANLTGRLVLDASEAANPFFDAALRRYDPSLLDLFGIPETARLLPEVVSGPDRAAPVCRDRAVELGLDPDTVVVLAPYDVPATAIGTGVVQTGSAFAVLGTTLCAGTVAESPRRDRPMSGMSLPAGAPDRWLIAFATMTGTEVLDWTARLLGLDDAAAVGALAARSTRDDLPLVMPYLSPAGERSPFLSTSVRGSMTGLDLTHSRADIARATLDGLTLAVLDCLLAAGTPTTLALSGGGAASDFWCRTICDAVGVPVTRPDVAEVGARGAVLSAAIDVGIFSDITAAVTTAVRPGATLQPDAQRHDYYRGAYDRFVAARETGA